MNRQSANLQLAIAEARQTLMEMVFTELDLGLTFLDVAATTTDTDHAHRCVGNAIVALRTADKFLSELSPEARSLDTIRERREQLALRLREFAGVSPRAAK